MKTENILCRLLALNLVIAAQVYAQDSFTNGLVAFYPFNGNANDASGNNHNGALIGYDWDYGFDRFGAQTSLYLNKTSPPSPSLDGPYVVVPRSATLDFNQDFTLSVWINLKSGTPAGFFPQNLLSNGPDVTNANLRVITDIVSEGGKDLLEFVWSDGKRVAAFLTPVRETWWQASVVRFGTNVSLYRNGSLLATSTATSTVNSSEIWLGRHICTDFPTTCGGTFPLFGGIDEVRMYNRALSPQEIRLLHQLEANPLPFLTVAVKTIRLSIFAELGKTNQLESSTNLAIWTPYGAPFVATNSVLYQDVDVLEGPQFFRVKWLIP